MFVYVMQNASMPGLLKVGYSFDPAANWPLTIAGHLT